MEQLNWSEQQAQNIYNQAVNEASDALSAAAPPGGTDAQSDTIIEDQPQARGITMEMRQDAMKIGRYEITGVIGQGGMGQGFTSLKIRYWKER